MASQCVIMEAESNTSVTNDSSKEELLARVTQLEAHVKQLKHLLLKAKGENDKGAKKYGKQRPFDFTRYHTRHVALKIVYLGWDYQGFAVQEDTDNTIEAALFKALLRTRLIESREVSCYHRCGRTDKGVSAFSQVISIDLRTNLLEGVGVKVRENGSAHLREGDKSTEIPYVHILNKVLPAEIRVLAWCPITPDFSARFSCKQRTYKYFFPKADLNIHLMRDAATRFIGEHDFRNLCKMDVGNGVVNFRRRILSTDLSLKENERLDERSAYQMYELTIVGQAFLWHQIRCIVALLFLVGQGKETPQIIDQLLDVETNPRKPQYTMASELPLVLFDAEFEDVDWIYEKETHVNNIQHLQEIWTQHSVRTAMVKRMLNKMETVTMTTAETSERSTLKELGSEITHQVECLIPGNKPRTYTPLLSRQKCESLEDRIGYFAKRRKLGQQKTHDSTSTDGSSLT